MINKSLKLKAVASKYAKPLLTGFIFLTNLSSMASTSSLSVQEGLSQGRSPWSVSFFSLMNTELGSHEQGGGRFSSYNYFTFSYRYGLDQKFAIRLPFQFNTAGHDNFNGDRTQSQELEFQDIIFSLVDYNLILLPFEVSTYWEGRVYLPTSKFSRSTDMITRLRNDIILNKALTSRLMLEYVSKFNYYYQSQTAYLNQFEGSDGYPVETVSLTKKVYHDSWVNAWYTLAPGTGAGFRVGWEDTYYNKSELNAKEKGPNHEIKLGPTFRFQLTDRANFILNLSDIASNKSRDDLGKFKTENLELTLLAFVGL